MNRKKLINEYILRNMIGKTIRIIKVLYFDSKVWYVAQNIQTPTHLYMCYFGHTKPSALAIERYLCDNSNQEVIEMIDAITIDDLPSTVVDIEDAIDVLDDCYKIDTLANLSNDMDSYMKKVNTVKDRCQEVINYEKHILMYQSKKSKDIKTDSISDWITQYVYHLSPIIPSDNDFDYMYAYFRNSCNDINMLESLYCNTIPNNGVVISYRYVYDPRFTYYCSKDYKDYLIDQMRNDNDDKEDRCNIFVMRHCMRLGKYTSTNLIPTDSNSLIQTSNLTAGTSNNETMYDMFNNSVEQLDSGEYASCRVCSKEDASIDKSDRCINPILSDLMVNDNTIKMEPNVIIDEKYAIRMTEVTTKGNNTVVYQPFTITLSVKDKCKMICSSLYLYEHLVAMNDEQQ